MRNLKASIIADSRTRESSRTRCAPRVLVALSRSCVVATALLLSLSFPALAGDASGVVKVVHMGPIYGANVFIEITGTVTSQPSCQAPNQYNFVFDSSTPAGKAMLATVLAAKASGSRIKASGYNQCTLFFNVEDLRWLSLE